MLTSFPLESLQLPFCALAAAILDRLLGEPRRWHPLVGFGRLAGAIETVLRPSGAAPTAQKSAGIAAWVLAVLPAVALAFLLRSRAPAWAAWSLDVALLYFALGAQSLRQHVAPIADRLRAGDLPGARTAVSRIVSRDTSALDEPAVARAAVESTLENGSDAVFRARRSPRRGPRVPGSHVNCRRNAP